MTKLSPQIQEVLKLALEECPTIWWPPLVNGKGSQSRTAGRHNSIYTAIRAGWLDQDVKITPAGRAVMAAAKEQQAAQDLSQRRRNLMRVLHWERGYRCHGLWLNDGTEQVASIGLGPASVWDGVYVWAIANHGKLDRNEARGETRSLAEAKLAVLNALVKAKVL